VNEIDPHPLDRIPPDSLDDIDLVSHTQSERKKLVSEVWKDFTPVYVEGQIQAADCVHCYKRVIADNSRRNLRRHTESCMKRGGTSISNLKSRKRKNNSANSSSNSQWSQEEPSVLFQSSVRTSKSRLQDEVSLTNGKVQTGEYDSKFHKGCSGDRTPVDQDILASQQRGKKGSYRTKYLNSSGYSRC
jgi:hypothetical protein